MTRSTLIDDDASQYDDINRRLRRLEQSTSRRATGQVTLTWPGGGDVSNIMTVNHNLGTGTEVVAVSNETSLNVAVVSVTGTTATIRARDVIGVRGAGSFGIARWIAVL
jgi:hypothetical protein